MEDLKQIQDQLCDFEIYDYPHTHKLIIDIYHNVYLGTNHYNDVITRISMNNKYAAWLIAKKDVLHILFNQGSWFKSEEHSDGDTKYLLELKDRMEENVKLLNKLNN